MTARAWEGGGALSSDEDSRPGPVDRPTIVGREAELAALARGLAEARRGEARLFLVVGEAGIGKTRLADAFAAAARASGARVLWGRCWEAGGATEYWPWVQVLRACLRDAPTDPGLRSAREWLRPVVDAPAEPPDGALADDPSRDRFRIFDAVATVLRAVASTAPLVIILDDLHVADEPTLLLLRFLIGELADVPVVILAIHREPELVAGDPRIPLLAALVREPSARRIEPTRLTSAQVGQLIRAATGRTPGDAVVRSVAERSDGNPLFVSEMARLLVEAGVDGVADDPVGAVPPSVKQVIGRRLERLSERARSTLQLAAVVGRAFDVDLIVELGVPTPEVLAAVDEASAAGIVHEGQGGIGRWRFSHVLVRDVLYESLPLPIRKGVHDRVGRAIERLTGDHPSELAHHAMLALPGGDAERARRFSTLAGRHASASAAHEEAVRHHANALATIDRDPTADDVLRCRLLIDLGDAQRRAGLASPASRTLLEAGAIAERLGRSEDLARAALAYGGPIVWLRAGLDPHVIPFLERALEARRGSDDILRCRLLARLAGALRGELDVARRSAISAEAVALARRLGDPGTLVQALVARQMAIAGPDALSEMEQLTHEMIALAPATRDPELVADVIGWSRVCWMTALGPPAGVMDRLVDRTGDAVEPLRLHAKSWYVAMLRNVQLLATGRYDGIEAAIDANRDVQDRSLAFDAEVSYRLARYSLARERGGLEALIPLLAVTPDELPGYWMFDAALVHAEAATGRTEEAMAHLDTYVNGRLDAAPRDSQWLWAMVQLADAAVLVQHRAAARMLLDRLRPYASLAATAAFEVVGGPVGRVVGTLADLLDEPQVAEDAFRAALAMAERTGWRPWEAWVCYAHARFLARSTGGRARAFADRLDRATAIAGDLGMPVLAGRIADLQAEQGVSTGVPVTAVQPTKVSGSETGPPENVARMGREGDVWAIGFEGRTIRLRTSKGLVHLAHLLPAPGRLVPAIELASVEEGRIQTAAAHLEAGLRPDAPSRDPLLDATARAEYRARIVDLQGEIDEALAFGDADRAERARTERDVLTRELAAALGLGGRPRSHPSEAERARQRVTKAIKAAVERIGEHDRALGDHLERAVQTGALCGYTPDPRATVTWTVSWASDADPWRSGA